MVSRGRLFSNERILQCTKLSADLTLYSTKFVLEHNKKSICFWNIKFLQTKWTIPKEFFERFSTCIIINRRLLSSYGIKEEGNLYNNLEFDEEEIECNSAKAFSNQCEKAGMLFLDEKYIAVPKTSDYKVESGEVSEEILSQSYYGYSTKPVEELSNLKPKYEFERLRNGEDVSHKVKQMQEYIV